MYDGVVENVKTCSSLINDFSITIGLHKGSTQRQLFFTIMMNKIIRAIHDKIPKYTLFANDICPSWWDKSWDKYQIGGIEITCES